MKTIVPCVLALLLVLGVAGAAEAQLCAGAPSFRDGPMQVGLGASFTDGARGVGGSFAYGGGSLFAGAGVSVLNFTEIDSLSTSITASAGADLQADDDGRVFVCPEGAVGFGVGPDLGPVDVSTASVRGGGNVGIVASNTPGLRVIPTFGLFAIYSNVTSEFGSIEESASDTSGLANLGVGFVFNRNVGVLPLLSIPFSTVGGSDVVFTLQFTFNFGS